MKQKKSSWMSALFAYAKNAKGELGLSVVLSVVSILLGLVPFFCMYRVICLFAAGTAAKAAVISWCAWSLAAYAGKVLCFTLSTGISHHAAYNILEGLRLRLVERFLHAPLGEVQKHSIGEIKSILVDKIENIGPPLAHMIPEGAGHIVLAGILVYRAVVSAMEKKSVAIAAGTQKSQADLTEAVLENVQGMSVIKSFNLSGRGDKKLQGAVEESRRANLAVGNVLTPYTIAQEAVLQLAGVGMMLAAILLWQGGTMTLAKALMVLVMSFMVFNQIKAFGMGVSMLRMAAASIDRTVETEQMPKMDEHGKAIAPAKHDIVFDHVDFSYEHKQILHDVSLTIPDKTTTAIVGPSGSGKSTLCSLMARFWDVDSGSVKIGGVDVRDYTLESLMDQISMVFQNVYLFVDTIENNIKFGCPDATHEQVVEAARKACCDDFIEALPDGYNTVIGEGGGTLSDGEKQRISIARAMLKDAPIVILDEATANVDPENEDRLQKAIEALTRDKTIIMIAHRLKTVRHADQILVVDHGRIVQQGTHEQLIGQPGIYAAFVGGRKQAEGWKL